MLQLYHVRAEYHSRILTEYNFNTSIVLYHNEPTQQPLTPRCHISKAKTLQVTTGMNSFIATVSMETIGYDMLTATEFGAMYHVSV